MSATKHRPFVHRPGCDNPQPVALCKCGENAVCRTCRWGTGACPCSCKKTIGRTLLEIDAAQFGHVSADLVAEIRDAWPAGGGTTE